MSKDVFMKVAGVDGESTDDAHKGWIELDSVVLSASQPRQATAAETPEGAAKASFSDLHVSFLLEQAYSGLMSKCASGEKIPEVIIQFHRATGKKELYFEIKLTDVIVSLVSLSGPRRDDDIYEPGQISTVGVAFNYATVQSTYTVTDNKTGRPAGNTKFGWDRKLNKPK
jgi:type VI secretion system secreted protein Hcp